MNPNAPIDLPGWIGVLQAAEAWGCPPWEVAGETKPNRLLWFVRRGAMEGEIARAGRDTQRHGKK